MSRKRTKEMAGKRWSFGAEFKAKVALAAYRNEHTSKMRVAGSGIIELLSAWTAEAELWVMCLSSACGSLKYEDIYIKEYQ